MERPYQLLVFDWDGTLMDSEARIIGCLAQTIDDLDLPMRERSQMKDIIGLGLPEAIGTLYPEGDGDLVRRFTDRYRYHFLSDHHAPTQLFAGALETLRTLATRGYFLAVATGKGRRGLDRSLQETGCHELFDVTRCADETRSKPHPQMLHEIMEVLDVPAERTVMIGDTEYDLQMARNAGAHALAVTYGVHERERLVIHEPLAYLDRIDDIVAWLADR